MNRTLPATPDITAFSWIATKRELDAFLQNAVHALYLDTPLPRPASALDSVYLNEPWTTAQDPPSQKTPKDGRDRAMPADDHVNTKPTRKRYVVIN